MDQQCPACTVQPSQRLMSEAGDNMRQAFIRFGVPITGVLGQLAMQIWMLGFRAGTHAGFQAGMQAQTGEDGEEPIHPVLAQMDVTAYPHGGH